MRIRLLFWICCAFGVPVASEAAAPPLIDFEPYQPAGWDAPVVPRAAADAFVNSCPAPATLPGEVASSYLNFVTRNNSSVDGMLPFQVQVELDGDLIYSAEISSFGANLSWTLVNLGPYTVPAGRHTLVLLADPFDNYEEADETNNIYGSQWIWEPVTISFGSTFVRSAPIDPSAGLEHVVGPSWPNCDGVRSPTFSQILNGYWGGFAVMPGDASDVTLNLHQLSNGATNGFAVPLAQSDWGVGESDLVFANRNYGSGTRFDAGVVKVSGNQDYSIQLIESTLNNPQINAVNPDYAIAADAIARLNEVYLYPGVYVISLENKNPAVPLGFGLYGPFNAMGQPYFGKSDTVTPDAISLDPGAGPLQYVTVEIVPGDEDFYCVAVWKHCAAELPNAASYTLNIRSGATSVEDEIPPHETQLDVYPNPFNPRTTVSFDIPRPEMVSFTLYDLRGARVRTISLGRKSAGRHEFQFNAIDNRGAPLASGRYLLEMLAGSMRERQAITLVK